MGQPYDNIDATRALQASAPARELNYAKMVSWGAYNLIKIMPRGELYTSVANYVTHLMSVSGKTPKEMEDILGLREGQLISGADIYRLQSVPGKDDFLPRGYSTLVDGLALKAGLKCDAAGYRPGHGAWQITLLSPVTATQIASLARNEVFEPGIHPNVPARYGR